MQLRERRERLRRLLLLLEDGDVHVEEQRLVGCVDEGEEKGKLVDIYC